MSGKSVGIIGGGAWGTAIAQALARGNHKVQIWAFEKEVADQYDLAQLSLEITEKDGAILLVWKGYSTNSNECVIVNAHTGEEVYRGSTVIVD